MTTLMERVSTAAVNYWNSPPRTLKRQIETWLETLEGVPEKERTKEKPVVLPGGFTTTYGQAIDSLCLGSTCNQARGWDLSPYHSRLKKLKDYEPKN